MKRERILTLCMDCRTGGRQYLEHCLDLAPFDLDGSIAIWPVTVALDELGNRIVAALIGDIDLAVPNCAILRAPSPLDAYSRAPHDTARQ